MLELKYDYHSIEAGCDEAGRGCLAGPVFAAAVILPDNFSNELLNDSKQLSEKQRAGLRPIIEREALAWAVASVDNHEIDKINILNASILAMHRALDQLKVRPGHIIVDGNRFKKYRDIPHLCIVKGDGTNIWKTFMLFFPFTIGKKTRGIRHRNTGKESNRLELRNFIVSVLLYWTHS